MGKSFQVTCPSCDAAMVDKTPDSAMHFFDCPNHCPGSQRIVQEENTSQEELDAERERHVQWKKEHP